MQISATTGKANLAIGVVLWACALLAILCGAPARAADDWVELRTPHFTIISEASESRTKEWATQFEIFRRAMNLIMPVDASLVDPVTLVLFRSDRRMRPFKPVENGVPARVAGYFVRAPGRNTIAVAIEGARDDVRPVIFHEAVHWHLSAAGRELPRWMEEGLAEVLGTFSISGKVFEIGAPRPEYIRFIKAAKPLPIAEMTKVERLRFNGKHGELTQVFYCQSWALMHSLLFASGDFGLPTFAAFLSAPATEKGLTSDLEIQLGLTQANLERRFTDYMNAGKFNMRRFPIDRSEVERGFALKPAAPGAVDLALGSLLHGSGRAAEAEAYFNRAIAALPEDARGYEGLAACSVAVDRIADAKRELDQAVSRSNASYFAHFLLAQIEVQELTSPRLSFGAPDFGGPIVRIARALALNPRFRDGFEMMAGLVSMSESPSPGAVKLLELGTTQFPGSWEIRLGRAFASQKTKDRAAAREHLAAARRLTPSGNIAAIGEMDKLEMELARP